MSNIPYGTSPAVTLPTDQNATPPTVTGTMWTGTDKFDAALTALVNRTLLELQRDALRWMQPGAYKMGNLIPGTNLIRYMAYGDLPVDDSLVLVEGEPNDPEGFGIGYDEFGVQQRMRTVRLTDVAMDVNPHNLMGVAAERLARNALAVSDFLVANTVGAATYNVAYAGGAAGRGTIPAGANLTAQEVRRAVTLMKKKNIPAFPDGFYRAMVDPNAVYDLMGDTSIGGWIEASKYASPEQLLNGELGRIYGVRFIETNVGLHITDNGGAGGEDIYRTVFFGPEYFAFGDLQSTRSYFVRPQPDHADPAAQSALLSWKGMYGALVFGDDTNEAVTQGAGPKHLILEHAGSLPLPA